MHLPPATTILPFLSLRRCHLGVLFTSTFSVSRYTLNDAEAFEWQETSRSIDYSFFRTIIISFSAADVM